MGGFIALSTDGEPRFYGLGDAGVGHVLIIGTGFMGDPLASGGMIEKGCAGKGLDASRLSERFQGDAQCKRCVAWLATDGGRNDLEASRVELNAWQYGTDAPEVRELTRGDVREGSARKPACEGTGRAPVPGSRVTRNDHSVSLPDNFNDKHSGKCPEDECGRIIAVSREGGMRRHNSPVPGTDVRETVPPVEAVREDATPARVGAVLTQEAMRAAYAGWLAAGHAVPAEVATLPDASAPRQWSVASDGTDPGVLVCEFKGDVEIVNPEQTHGKCPECSTYIALQDVESDPDATRIGKHNVRGIATPAHKGLSSTSVPVVEHGSVPGDPATADKRRAAESRCTRSGKISRNKSGGIKPCPTCDRPVELVKRETPKGEKWIFPEHVRPGDSFRASGGDAGYVASERTVTPRGTGADAGKGARDHGSVDGSANVGRVNLPPVQPTRGYLAAAGTMALSMTVRPGVDSKVSPELCPVCQEWPEIAHRGKSRGWRRAHSKQIGAILRDRAARRDAVAEREIAKGERLPKGARRAMRKAASIGSRADGTQATSGRVIHPQD